jgi:hypothetical protein
MKASSVLSAVAAISLFATTAFAADAPLPAGRPAGTKQAALAGMGLLPLTVLVGFTTLVIVAAAGGFSKSSAAATPISPVTTGTGA